MPITALNVSFTYMKKTPYEKKALDGITLTVNDGEIFGIIGSTGSGKSTFVQHLNGLIKAESGKIEVFDIDLSAKKPDYKRLRQTVGMVFQYPEYQLFEETVEKDVAFGPANQGLTGEELTACVKKAIEDVGLNYEAVKNASPFELSGGQKRRVALAGILAMKPKILILDEPTAGLDPVGKEEILNLIRRLHGPVIETVIIISHDMDEISDIADRIAVFHNSHLIYVEEPYKLFAHAEELKSIGLDVPCVVEIKNMLKNNGIDIPDQIIKPDDFAAYVKELYNKR